MAGAGLVAIKRRIKSITNTRKITSAMGLVSTSKYKKIKDKTEINNSYLFKVEEVIKQLKENYEEESIYISGNNSSKKLYIVVTSDAGLCGGYNWSIANELLARLKSNNEDCDVIVVGQKGRAILKKLKIETVAEYVDLSDMSFKEDANEIINHALSMYDNEEIGEIYIVYKKLILGLKNEVIIEKVLPLNFQEEKDTVNEYIDIESIDEDAFQSIVLLFLKSKMLNSILHSKASEHRARMESMGSATNNANDILEKLSLKYNRIRQSAITQEISEIVGGAEAQR